jgi:hypothetical protein
MEDEYDYFEEFSGIAVDAEFGDQIEDVIGEGVSPEDRPLVRREMAACLSGAAGMAQYTGFHPFTVIGADWALTDYGIEVATTRLDWCHRVLRLLDERFSFAKGERRESFFDAAMDYLPRAANDDELAAKISLAWQSELRNAWGYLKNQRRVCSRVAETDRSSRRPLRSARRLRSVRRHTVRSGCSPGRSSDEGPEPDLVGRASLGGAW